MKTWNPYLTTTCALAGLLLLPAAHAQETPAENAPETPQAEQIPGPEAGVDGLDAVTLNPDLVWISFIVDDGRVQSNRDYFGALSKEDMDSLTGGSKEGMIRVQQVFYYNAATRQFSRFDAAAGDTIPLLERSGYFRADSIMRVVPLNENFVKSLAVRKFINVEGE